MKLRVPQKQYITKIVNTLENSAVCNIYDESHKNKIKMGGLEGGW